MRKTTIAGGGCVLALLLVAAVAAYRVIGRGAAVTAPAPTTATAPAARSAAQAPLATAADQGFLYGRVTTVDGDTLEGRLRWGVHQEAFWSDYFNGVKRDNPWLAHVPPERLPRERHPVTIFGLELGSRESEINVRRQLMARFGELARLQAHGREVRATLKNGTVYDLDRLDASDFDDGLRVWDGRRGVVDLGTLQIRAVELLPTPALGAVPSRLHGTLQTKEGEFTGFVAWNRLELVDTDELDGQTADGNPVSLRFATIRSIARRSRDSATVTLRDGREVVVADSAEVGRRSSGVYVSDPRFGRLLISWGAFERVDFGPGSSGPAYGDFAPGRELTGSVTTRDGRRLAGRLVYDLDENESTDTLDAEAGAGGVHYTIPLDLIASVTPLAPEEDGPARARLTLHSGIELQLAGTSDVGEGHAGILVFLAGQQRPEYVAWAEVDRVDFERPPPR